MLLRDRLRARLNAEPAPDYQQLAADVLGIRNAPPELARKLVSQALVVEDRREEWLRIGERICENAPAVPGVYVLRDADGRALYVGKASNLRRRLRTHFSGRRWRGLKADFARAVDAEWEEVGSELEALLREAILIDELAPLVNVQIGPPDLSTRNVPAAILRDVIVIVPSRDEEFVQLVGARVADSAWLMERARRDGAGITGLASRLSRFFHSPLRGQFQGPPFAPIVFSWLAGRGAAATRLDPHDGSRRELRTRLTALIRDPALFAERIVVR
jgi:predicted GIY-YIG superfamily endonuclease